MRKPIKGDLLRIKTNAGLGEWNGLNVRILKVDPDKNDKFPYNVIDSRSDNQCTIWVKRESLTKRPVNKKALK